MKKRAKTDGAADADRGMIRLPNRYGYANTLVEVAPDIYVLTLAPGIGYCSYSEGSIDPAGGPFLAVGAIMGKKEVLAFAHGADGHSYMCLGPVRKRPSRLPQPKAAAALTEYMKEHVRPAADSPVGTYTATTTGSVWTMNQEAESCTCSTAADISVTITDAKELAGCHFSPLSNLVVGVIGKAGSGKDTIADYLVERRGFLKMALADPIRRIIETVFFVDFSDYHTDREMRDRPLPDYPDWTVRRLQQVIGTELFRQNIDQDVWVKNLCARIAARPGPVVVADVRFPNEIDVVRSILEKQGRKVVFVKVVRKGCEGKVGLAKHASEAYDLEGDYTLKNNGTIARLHRQVDKVLDGLGK